MEVQFNKDDVEELGLIKMDMLGLRMLSVVAEALDLIEAVTGTRPDLDALDLKDPEVYELCKQADTIGVFQIESRSQMRTLPRARPETFNDLVVEVAIIRPGPIQGDAVHPYLRRKQGKEPVMYIHPRLKPILEETLGVVLYQEQILKISMDCAGFSSAEADRFRRAMGSHRSHDLMAAIASGSLLAARRTRSRGRSPRRSSPSWRRSPSSASPSRTQPPSPAPITRPPGSNCITRPHSMPDCSTTSRWASITRTCWWRTPSTTASRSCRSTSTRATCAAPWRAARCGWVSTTCTAWATRRSRCWRKPSSKGRLRRSRSSAGASG